MARARAPPVQKGISWRVQAGLPAPAAALDTTRQQRAEMLAPRVTRGISRRAAGRVCVAHVQQAKPARLLASPDAIYARWASTPGSPPAHVLTVMPGSTRVYRRAGRARRARTAKSPCWQATAAAPLAARGASIVAIPHVSRVLWGNTRALLGRRYAATVSRERRKALLARPAAQHARPASLRPRLG